MNATPAPEPSGPPPREQAPGRLVLRMFSFLRPIRWTALIAGLVVLARAGTEVWAVWYVKEAVTAVGAIHNGHETRSFREWLAADDGSAAELRSLLLWMAGVQLLMGWTIYLRNVWDGRFSMRAVYYIREAVYDRLQHIGFSFHDRMTSGQIINRALSDLQNVRMFLNLSVIGALDIAAYIVGYFGLLMLCSTWLAAALLAPVPLWWWVINRFSTQAQPLFEKQQDASDAQMTALTENLQGVHVVRSFGTERQEIAKYARLNDGLLDRMFAMVRLQQRLNPTLRGIAIAAHIGLFLLAAALIRSGHLAVGDLMPIGLAIATILAKLQQINVLTEAYQKAIVSARRLFEVLDTPANVAARPGAPAPKFTAGEIEFADVVFGYDEAKPVLRGVSCRIPGNKMTAIVGPTGAGKSTMASLIARFYDPQAGAVRIDGQDLRDVDLRELRRSVGFVFQETFLFSDTVRNNIRYGRTDVSDDMVRAAAEAAQASDFIERLSEGYETMLGERGVTLSGGQKQRLALARALVYDPKILVLDDATAALDAETEEVVATILNLLYAGRTVLTIAHRMSTVRRADHILVVEDGRVVQSGTHRELTAAPGYYRDVARMQLSLDDGRTARSHTARVAAETLERTARA